MKAGFSLPDAVARCVAPSATVALRIDVARGAIPLPPTQRLLSLAVLLADPDATVQTEARSALERLPAGFVEEALGDRELPGPAVDAAAWAAEGKPEVLWKALSHSAVEPRTAERYLDDPDEEAIARIAHNQRLLDRSPELGRRLIDHPLLHPAERSRLASLYGEEEGAQEQLAEDVPLPPDLPTELLEDVPDKGAEGSQNLYQVVQSMTVAEKIKLAMLGSKSARRLLIRDTNKLVAVAVIRSPKIREDEVAAIAQERTVADEVIRIILTRKDWLKSYPLRLALCQNPKTPIPRALRLLETLQEKDLRQLAKSRNVSSAVATGALRALARRGKT